MQLRIPPENLLSKLTRWEKTHFHAILGHHYHDDILLLWLDETVTTNPNRKVRAIVKEIANSENQPENNKDNLARNAPQKRKC